MASLVVMCEAPTQHSAEEVYLATVGGDTDAFWLDSGDEGISFIGSGAPWAPNPPVLDALRRELAVQRQEDAAGFPLGLVGWLEYGLRRETMEVEVEPGAASAHFLRVDRGVRVLSDGHCALVASGATWSGETSSWRDRILASLDRSTRTVPSFTASAGSVSWRLSGGRYLELVEACQARIRDGEAYVLNLSNEATVEGQFDPVEVHLRLRAATPSHHGGLIRIGDTSLVSASTEQFLGVAADRRVVTSPVKGTVARAAHIPADRIVAASLVADEKERAENLMIVDLMRNDLARVSDFADIDVPDLFRVETHTHIHQLVSTVRGRLRPDCDVVDLLVATFPAGSMTGAPKHRAVQILHQMEARERGLYAGAFGYFAVDGRVDLAMTIRSIVVRDNEAVVGVGGGITALSDPLRELQEIHVKAGPLLRALGVEA